jgi:hypothetical protein
MFYPYLMKISNPTNSILTAKKKVPPFILKLARRTKPEKRGVRMYVERRRMQCNKEFGLFVKPSFSGP